MCILLSFSYYAESNVALESMTTEDENKSTADSLHKSSTVSKPATAAEGSQVSKVSQ